MYASTTKGLRLPLLCEQSIWLLNRDIIERCHIYYDHFPLNGPITIHTSSSCMLIAYPETIAPCLGLQDACCITYTHVILVLQFLWFRPIKNVKSVPYCLISDIFLMYKELLSGTFEHTFWYDKVYPLQRPKKCWNCIIFIIFINPIV